MGGGLKRTQQLRSLFIKKKNYLGLELNIGPQDPGNCELDETAIYI